MLLLALAYECSQKKRNIYDMVMARCPPPPCPPKPPPPCPPKPPPPLPPEPCPLPPDVRCAATQVIGSIALEEAALAHIMNAEGEKIQAALANTSDIDQMLAVNASVADTLRVVVELEQSLQEKLRLAVELLRGEEVRGEE